MNPGSKHKYAVGDLVVFTNEFGVCWGVVKIAELAEGFTEADGPRYHYVNSDTPWYPTSEKNLTPADTQDKCIDMLKASHRDMWWWYFNSKYGWTPTPEQLGGCG
ncbi:MAG: hypothetical protein LC687_06360 [Actinobacteria bacterium]|nr:hypothetical protein [Actinomycetota bacterium]